MLRSIKGKNKFREVFTTSSKKIYADNAYCFVLFNKNYNNEPEQENCLNYAVIVKKKTAKKAVCRNRAKRLMREVLRKALPEMESKRYYKAIKYLVIYWAKPMMSPKLLRYQDVEIAIAQLLEKVENYFENKIKVSDVEENIKIAD